jgi:hypothetical protein
MRWSEQEYLDYLKRQGIPLTPIHTTPEAPAPRLTAMPLAPTVYKSKTEARYADVLRWRVADHTIAGWLYEPMSLRLGADLFYRPDFLIWRAETPLLELVEVKGSWIRDRAMHKPRMAATRFPCFTFTLAVWDRQRWTETRIQAHEETPHALLP